MQQSFLLKIADESLCDLMSDSLIYHIKKIKVTASLEIVDHILKVHFDIRLPLNLQEEVEWQALDEQCMLKKDFLWHNTCLECFIGDSKYTDYVEINASPNGYFAIYHFDNYRIPNCMPPRALITHSSQHVKIDWQKHNKPYQRTFMFDINTLPNELQSANIFNPTMILYLKNNQLPLFFAPNHATPADFHNQNFWIKRHNTSA